MPRRFILADFEPSYLELSRSGALEERIATARQELTNCCACPRECGVNRQAGEVGVCRSGERAIVASAAPHLGEETCLVGRRGSGTIFFSLCNLKCVFCQNHDLSQRAAGTEVTPDEIAELMLRLQEWGCHNINLVTPEHVVPQVVLAIDLAIGRGLRLPIVYNTSGYDSLESLRLLDGLIDIYMPDFKYWEPESARRFSKARDYPERARAAITEMQRQVGVLHCDEDGVALRGLLVRHLVMPGLGEQSTAIFQWLATDISPDTFVNIMDQYRPSFRVGAPLPSGAVRFEELNRRSSPRELAAAFAAARAAGLWRFD
ncbi:MAG: radical SAM protein [bacterium]